MNDKGRRLTRVFNSSKSAQHYAATVEYQLKYGNPEEVFREPAAAPPPPAPTFKDATKRWLAVDGPSFKSGTLEDYECILSLHNLPTFANRPLPSITRAEASELIAQSPVIAIAGRIGREAGEARQAEWLTEPELAAVLRAIETREPRYYLILLTIASTGLRLGEAVGLQVGDVDLERCKLSVRRAIRKRR